jgi:hypothetical protein
MMSLNSLTLQQVLLGLVFLGDWKVKSMAPYAFISSAGMSKAKDSIIIYDVLSTSDASRQ